MWEAFWIVLISVAAITCFIFMIAALSLILHCLVKAATVGFYRGKQFAERRKYKAER